MMNTKFVTVFCAVFSLNASICLATAPKPLHLESDKMMVLFGTLDLAKAVAFLDPKGLKPLEIGPIVPAAFAAETHPSGELRAYSELYFAIMATRKDDPNSIPHFYFVKTVTTTVQSQAYWRYTWNYPYQLGRVNVNMAPDSVNDFGAYEADGSLIARFEMAQRSFPSLTPHYDVATALFPTWNSQGVMKSYPFDFKGYGYKTPFNPATDRFELSSCLQGLAEEVGFIPLEWRMFFGIKFDIHKTNIPF